MKSQREQFQKDDFADPERMRRVLNEYALGVATRLEALEAVRGLTVLPEVAFDTGSSIGPTLNPFATSTGLKVAVPFVPTGLVLLQLQQVKPSNATIPTNASDVKWHAVPNPDGTASLQIDFVTGLATTSASYRMLLGVTRA